MWNKLIQNKTLVLVLLISVLAFLRVFIQIPNVAPIAAIALFAGTYFKRKKLAFLFPITILLISDIFIGFYDFALMLGVYIAFVIITMIGFWLKKNVKTSTVIAGSLASSVLFFIITNFAVWAQGLWYPISTGGLIQCYAMAIPFFRYEVLGTLAFSAFFFGAYSVYLKYVPFIILKRG